MNFFFTNRFYYAIGIIASLFIFSWLMGFSIQVPVVLITCVTILTVTDAAVLFLNKRAVKSERWMSDRFSNGDKNLVQLHLTSFYGFKIQLQMLEELPEQFQARNNVLETTIAPLSSTRYSYYLRPIHRGVYQFGHTQLLVASPLQLVRRRIRGSEPAAVAVYPSFVQMRKYELQARQALQNSVGNKRLRKIGHSMEFEQIKEYVGGDDIRSLNWKATARKGSLMVNHFADERSQQVYCLIDKGRLMKMPFDGLSLLDYAINTSLVLCNVSLHRQDKFGLISFSHKAGSVLLADRRPIQLDNTLQALYKLDTAFLESDFEKLYLQVRTYIRHRSLLVLFTNFESLAGMRRQLPYLKQLAKHHLLLVVFFENSELKQMTEENVHELEALYTKIIASKFVLEKRMIVKELQQNGILSILTTPEQLTVNAVNKYLELKTRQAI